MAFLSQVSGFFLGGGPFMFIILAAGLLMLAITAERFWVIGRASALNSGAFMKDLMKSAGQGDLSSATALCRKVKSPAGRVAFAIVSTNARDEQTLNNAADGAAMVVLPTLSKRLPHLSMLANVATLLGLLGTIFGLTAAFAAVGAADPSQRSAFLAAGISQALNTTAFGLMIAVPAMIAHAFLVGKVEGIVEQVDEVSVRLVRVMTGKTEQF
jgi:biopolymer transport protein ExbB